METENPRVFVVDDDEAVCESLRLLVEDIGLEVKTFSNSPCSFSPGTMQTKEAA